MPDIKKGRKKANKRCPSCAVQFSPKLEICPKCGYVALPTPEFTSKRKPLKSGKKLNLK